MERDVSVKDETDQTEKAREFVARLEAGRAAVVTPEVARVRETLNESGRELFDFMANLAAMSRQIDDHQGRVNPTRYHSMHELVLKHGIWFPPVTSPPKQHMRGELRACFRNAAVQVLVNRERYVYCEGYALAMIPVLHAWVWDREAQAAYELTWRRPGDAYCGIPFDCAYAREKWASEHQLHPITLIDRWEEGWPLVAGADRVEDVIHEDWRGK